MRRGKATDIIRGLLDKEGVDCVYTIGSVEMMEAVARITKAKNIKTLMQVTAGISCGAGKCGACRTKVSGQIRLSCQDGPEFDAHEVDFDYLKVRIKAFALPARASQSQGKRSISDPKVLAKFMSSFEGS